MTLHLVVDAIATYSGHLRDRIIRFKEQNKHGWATFSGRILLGHLERSYDTASIDLIAANPTHPSRVPRHTELVIERAATDDFFDEWPFDTVEPRALVQTHLTAGSGGADVSYAHKREVARQVAEGLAIPDPDRIAGKRVLPYDDICTTGLQLDAVAKRLLGEGAASVRAVVLARTPWS
jgi:predicted amidophosphoribosyltransferase